MIVKFNPQGRVMMVFGRKSEASDAEAKPHERNPETAAAAPGRPLPPADRRDLGPGRHDLHLRRLREFARRQDQQGRRLDQVVGPARQGAGRVQHSSQHRGRRQGQHLCRRPRQPPHPGVRRRRQLPARDQDRRAVRSRTPSLRSATSPISPTTSRPAAASRRARRGRCASRRRRTRCSTARMPIRAASTSSRSTARCSACWASRASSSSSSAGSTRWRARPRTCCSSPKS